MKFLTVLSKCLNKSVIVQKCHILLDSGGRLDYTSVDPYKSHSFILSVAVIVHTFVCVCVWVLDRING